MLHIADLHIGATLNGYDLLSDQEYTLDSIIRIIKDKNIKYLLLCGDIYDKYNPSNETIALFESFLKKISFLNVRTIIIAGNHDSKARLSYLSNFLKSYNIFIYTKLEDLEKPLEFDDDKLSFLPIPYLNKKELELYYDDFESSNNQLHKKLIKDYFTNCNKNYKHIALAHNLFIGGKMSSSERTLSVGGLDNLDKSIFKGFDYTALGHLHLYQDLGNNIYYTGSICKYSISEFKNDNSCNIYNYLDNSVNRLSLDQLHKARILEGSFEQIVEASKSDLARTDYIHIELTDNKPIYDAFNRLSNQYSNLVSIAYKKLQMSSEEKQSFTTNEVLDEVELVKEFYKSKLGKEIDKEASDYLMEVINKVRISK